MKLNLAWARQYPEHPLAQAIKWLEKYWDLGKDKDAAARAINQMVEIQKKIGITDTARQDGIIWTGTLRMYEAENKAKEMQDAQKLIKEFDQSLYAPDLAKRTNAALQWKKQSTLMEIGSTVWNKWVREGFRMLWDAMGGTKVKDAEWVEYTITKWDNWQIQYRAENGNIFEVKDGKKFIIKYDEKSDEYRTHLDAQKTEALRLAVMMRTWNDNDNTNINEPITVTDINGKKIQINMEGNVIAATENASEKKSLWATLTDIDIKRSIDGSWTIEALKANMNLRGATITQEWDNPNIIKVIKDWQTIYLTKRDWPKPWWDISDKSPAEQKQEIYQKDQEALGGMIDPVLDWQNGAWTSYRDLKIWDFASTKDRFYGDGGDNWNEGVLPSGQKVYLGHRTAQAYIENIYNQIPEEDREALSKSWVTFGEFLEMKKDPVKAAQRLAGTDKPTRLPNGLWEENMLYQRWGNGIILKTNQKGTPRSIIENWREQNIVEYAMTSSNMSIDLPNGARIFRTIEWDKQVLKYFAKKDADTPSFTYKWR